MGFLLLLPFFGVRFGLLGRYGREAVLRAAHFAPMQGGERVAYWLYQLTSVAIIVYIGVSQIQTRPAGLFAGGLAVYIAGLVLLAAAVVAFAATPPGEMNVKGLYRLSRNPMYVAYLAIFAGCALLVQSWLLAALVAVFQVSAHWIIRAEERWCQRQLGDDYRRYMQRVRRYF